MSFWSKLTGSLSADDYDDLFDGGEESPRRADAYAPTTKPGAQAIRQNAQSLPPVTSPSSSPDMLSSLAEEIVQIGELSVDVYETQNEIVVKALVAGVQPSNIDINLTRDMLTLKGTREEHKEVAEERYFHKELFWGGFARSIVLPEEVDVDTADASIAHGILLIRLPKINKERQAKVKVRTR